MTDCKRPRPSNTTRDSKCGSRKARKVDANLTEYSLDDLRRLTYKLIELGVVQPSHVEHYVQDEPNIEKHDRILCTYDSTVEWTSYTIRNQDFNFPHFMQEPVYLARGGFGTVAKCFRYGEPVAVKKVEVPDARHREMALRLLRELVIMKQAKKLGQRHICKIIDVFGDPTVKRPEDLHHIYIVMPLYTPGALDSTAVSTPEMFKTIAGHTLSALHFLHLHKIMHRDIKKENIFYDAVKNRAYLADLGQARTWDSKRMSGNGTVGTRCYVSPEILQGFHYDFRSDVYSLGQTWYEVLCLTGNHSIFPWGKSGGQEHIDMQWALDPIQTRLRLMQGEYEGPNDMWAKDKWDALRAKAEKWKEDALVGILEAMLMFNPENRADTHALFCMSYFAPFVTSNETMDLRSVEKADYSVIKQRLFELQHGDCQRAAGKGGYQRMCSRAVQYFVESCTKRS